MLKTAEISSTVIIDVSMTTCRFSQNIARGLFNDIVGSYHQLLQKDKLVDVVFPKKGVRNEDVLVPKQTSNFLWNEYKFICSHGT